MTRCSDKGVSDAQHAAVAIENACTWVTRDEDFSAFTRHGLRLELWRPKAVVRPSELTGNSRAREGIISVVLASLALLRIALEGVA